MFLTYNNWLVDLEEEDEENFENDSIEDHKKKQDRF
jgi:hypothetical protein